MARERLLLIDSCISNKVASILRKRGRVALSFSQLGIQHAKDPGVLKRIHDEYPDSVLVTYDDHLPEDHKPEVDKYRPTVAIIDPIVGQAYDQFGEEEVWKWEVCLRWAHRMQDQEPNTIKRYTDRGAQTWKKPRNPRIKPKRQLALPPTGLAASPPIIPKEEEIHEQGQFDFP